MFSLLAKVLPLTITLLFAGRAFPATFRWYTKIDRINLETIVYVPKETAYRISRGLSRMPDLNKSGLNGVILLFGNESERTAYLADDLRWMNAANEWGMLLVTIEVRAERHSEKMAADIARNLPETLNLLSRECGIPKAGSLPRILWGEGSGGDIVSALAAHYPDQTIAAIICRNRTGPGDGKSAAKSSVPMLLLANQSDTTTSAWKAGSYFAEGRRQQAPWALAVHTDDGTRGLSWNLERSFLDGVVKQRLDSKTAVPQLHQGGAGAGLMQPNMEGAWAGLAKDRQVFIGKLAEARGVDPETLSWFPNEACAEAWKAYLGDNLAAGVWRTEYGGVAISSTPEKGRLIQVRPDPKQYKFFWIEAPIPREAVVARLRWSVRWVESPALGGAISAEDYSVAGRSAWRANAPESKSSSLSKSFVYRQDTVPTELTVKELIETSHIEEVQGKMAYWMIAVFPRNGGLLEFTDLKPEWR